LVDTVFTPLMVPILLAAGLIKVSILETMVLLASLT
jgi:hypothetical protein